MKKNLRLILLATLIGTAGMMSSCNKDDMETIVVKRSGSLTVKIINGETPVADTKIRFYNEDTGNEVDVLVTDANGTINLGELNEGTYAVSAEINSPKYTEIYQEIQVISGQATNKTIQVTDYVGTFTFGLTDTHTGEAVTEDIGLGFAFVPDNDALNRARTPEEALALATEIKYFGTAGEIVFDLPTAEYLVFRVRGDSILTSEDEVSIGKLEDRFKRIFIDVDQEKIKNKAQWSVANAVDELNVPVADFPISSVKFFNNGGNRLEIALNNGVVLSASFSFYDNKYIDIYNKSTNNGDYYFYTNDIQYEFDAQGNLILTFSYFEVYNYSGDDDFEKYNFTVNLN